MNVEIRILKEGDTVAGIWENRLLVRHADGTAEFFILEIDEHGLPRIGNTTRLITQGDREIYVSNEQKKKRSRKGDPKGPSAEKDIRGIKLITF